MHNYFCGWYYRCQSEAQTLAVIPSVHRTGAEEFCAIQLITDTGAYHIPFSCSPHSRQAAGIRIEENRFDTDGLTLHIHTPELHAFGSLRFGCFTPLRYDIMGPFRYVPFMQCRHSVFSMKHSVSGEIRINDVPYVFRNADGYTEGDRGRSFPKKYLWAQAFFPEGSVMLSVAEIPFGLLHFTGLIGIVKLHEKEFRLATYLGAKPVRITPHEIIVRQGKYTLTLRPRSSAGHLLRAPVGGAMCRTIHESPACSVYFRFEENGAPLLELDAKNAALEYEY